MIPLMFLFLLLCVVIGFVWQMHQIHENRYPIYVTMTTMPDRIMTPQFKTYINEIVKQDPYQVILNVPYVFERTGEVYRVPDWIMYEEPFASKITIHRCQDIGPSTKLLGGIDLIPDNVPVISMDDDLLYKDFVISELVEAWKAQPDQVTCFHTIKEKDWKRKGYDIVIPEGYSGCITRSNHIKTLSKKFIPDSCRYIDDHWLGYQYYQLGIPVKQLSPLWDYPIDRVEHDKKHTWLELKRVTNRTIQQSLCLNDLIKKDSYPL